MKSEAPLDGATAFRYPLELVAKVAAELLPRNAAGKYALEQFYVAAEQSVKLLNACQLTLIQDRDDAEQRQREMGANIVASGERNKERHALEEKYPNGLTGRRYVLFVTGQDSQADALEPFKRWRRYFLEALRAKEGVSARTPEQIDEEVQGEVRRMRRSSTQRHYTCEEALRDRREFQVWYTTVAIPAVRSAAGKKGGGKKHKKILDAAKDNPK